MSPVSCLTVPARLRRLGRRTIVVALLLAPASLMSAAQAEQEAASQPVLTVSVTRPERVQLPLRLRANGDIAAWQEASVGAQVSGLRLQELKAEAGDVVRAGQVLAVLDQQAPQAAQAQARAAVLEAEAAAAEAQANAARAVALRGSGAMSEQQLDQLQAAAQIAEARIASARAVLEVRALDLRHTRVLAPDDGLIVERQATLGAVVNAGSELFRLIRQRRLEWRARLAEAELGAVSPGQVVRVELADGSMLEGKVRRIAPQVDAHTRFGLAYVDLPAAQAGAGKARAGMFARGEFELGAAEALTVPEQALVVREAFSHVFVVDAERRVHLTRVEAGRRADGRIEIRRGLAADAEVVAAGAGFLNDGDRVRIAPALAVP